MKQRKVGDVVYADYGDGAYKGTIIGIKTWWIFTRYLIKLDGTRTLNIAVRESDIWDGDDI